ncbi:MAG: rhomboid family intramembrane serine protease [Treponema sp.]|nr:rhomboid family intramembrane serine protease [Treponema sp.]
MSILKRPFKYANYNTVYWLIGINVLIFAAMQFFGKNVVAYVDVSDLGLVDRFGRQIDEGGLTVSNMLAMIPQAVIKNGAIWTFVTYMFMHGNFSHILFNMIGLFIFGVHVERQMGSKEFLLFYFVTGTLAGIFSFIVYYFTGNFLVALVGASGALYAVQLAYAVFFPHSIIYIWGILPLRAPVMVLGFTALSLFFVITGSGGNVAHLTHLAGFAFGWLYFMIRFSVNPWKRLTGR